MRISISIQKPNHAGNDWNLQRKSDRIRLPKTFLIFISRHQDNCEFSLLFCYSWKIENLKFKLRVFWQRVRRRGCLTRHWSSNRKRDFQPLCPLCQCGVKVYEAWHDFENLELFLYPFLVIIKTRFSIEIRPRKWTTWHTFFIWTFGRRINPIWYARICMYIAMMQTSTENKDNNNHW